MDNSVSTRTPEGESNRCPVCRNRVQLFPSQPFGDAPCPNCGHLLWFINSKSSGEILFPAAEEVIRKRFEELLDERFGDRRSEIFSRSRFIEDLGLDSLDVVELVMQLEEGLMSDDG